ncbi:unnamed protein product, partial [Amoebophrya sp. A25]
GHGDWLGFRDAGGRDEGNGHRPAGNETAETDSTTTRTAVSLLQAIKAKTAATVIRRRETSSSATPTAAAQEDVNTGTPADVDDVLLKVTPEMLEEQNIAADVDWDLNTTTNDQEDDVDREQNENDGAAGAPENTTSNLMLIPPAGATAISGAAATVIESASSEAPPQAATTTSNRRPNMQRSPGTGAIDIQPLASEIQQQNTRGQGGE